MESTTDQLKSNSRGLRWMQKQVARNLVLGALAEIISEGRILDFTLTEVAARAGVSYKSVYRHLPTREALLEELAVWAQELLAATGPRLPDSLDMLPEWIRSRVQVWEQHRNIIRAAVTTSTASGIVPPVRMAADRLIIQKVQERAPHLSAEEHQEFAGVIRFLGSVDGWLALRERFGVSSPRIGRALGRSLKAVIDDLDERDTRLSKGASSVDEPEDARLSL